MDTFESFERDLYTLPDSPSRFNEFATRLFQFQYENNPIYRQYCQLLGIRAEVVWDVAHIPFLPIEFFKTQLVKSGNWSPQKVYTSSGTTGLQTSKHEVKDEAFYLEHTVRTFERNYGPLDQYDFFALLPSYLERTGSSLIAMANHFIHKSQSTESGFYLNNQPELVARLQDLRQSNRRPILLGVTFALLELAENYEVDLSHCIVMETGGMKGRRPELTRQELHAFLSSRFNVNAIHSEYGMTELFSQAYSKGNGLFQCPPWMKVVIRDPEDPFEWGGTRIQGAINLIDLANFHSCAFIETQDLGRLNSAGYFEVLGRMDNSDIRGCNLLVG